MCRLRAWSQILLPVFLSLFFIQLLISFSENGFSQISTHRNKKRPAAVEDVCAGKKNCDLCTENKKCIWCSEEKACLKYCFPYFECRMSAIFWLNCRVDLFGILMITLAILLVIALIWYCCMWHLHHTSTQVSLGGRQQSIYLHPNSPPMYDDTELT